uniref:Carbamoyltransferase n=1 Tax=uncultured bacterium N27-1E TaxID=1497526 RepID=A0A059U0G1_9BACT|nr:carbamoyltransferase [uncultured bacterium N27-1E]
MTGGPHPRPPLPIARGWPGHEGRPRSLLRVDKNRAGKCYPPMGSVARERLEFLERAMPDAHEAAPKRTFGTLFKRRVTSTVGMTHPTIGKIARALTMKVGEPVLARFGYHRMTQPFAREKVREFRQRLQRGERVYLLGLGAAGHSAAACLVEASLKDGLVLLQNNEEERFTGIKHEQEFPRHALRAVMQELNRRGAKPDDIVAVLASWDHVTMLANGARLVTEEAPASFLLTRSDASPKMNFRHILRALASPGPLAEFFPGEKRVPVIGMRHHDNHAYFSYAASPFYGSDEPVILTVIDGYGDDGCASLYVARNGAIELLHVNPIIFDSLGMLYTVVSSTQGGWTSLSSEGRFMGAAAWGDGSRLTNRFYRLLRQLIVLEPEGAVRLNRSMFNIHRRAEEVPYREALKEILGEPIALRDMWSPDAVLKVEDIDHSELSRDRVDKAAALQMVFEDGLFHIVDHLIRETGATRLVLSGGTALNCLANMRLLEQFDEAYYRRLPGDHAGERLHLWVPPTPSDAGVAMGAAYNFALRFAGDLLESRRFEHAFYCGATPTTEQIRLALRRAPDMEWVEMGNLGTRDARESWAELIADVIAANGIVGIYQGVAETGPRALGHRSILANPCNPRTLEVLNARVKYREAIRPLAPMVSRRDAERLFELSPGAASADYNAYNYMVLTVAAKPGTKERIPAVIHEDGTARIQIVRPEHDPLSYACLEAMGRRTGVEVLVNTSLNVGAPIAQDAQQALETLRRAKGMDGLVMVGEDGTALAVWCRGKPSMLGQMVGDGPPTSGQRG